MLAFHGVLLVMYDLFASEEGVRAFLGDEVQPVIAGLLGHLLAECCRQDSGGIGGSRQSVISLQCTGSARDLVVAPLGCWHGGLQGAFTSAPAYSPLHVVARHLMDRLDRPWAPPEGWPDGCPLPAEIDTPRKALGTLARLTSQAALWGPGVGPLEPQGLLDEPVQANISLLLDHKGQLVGLNLTAMQAIVDGSAHLRFEEALRQRQQLRQDPDQEAGTEAMEWHPRPH